MPRKNNNQAKYAVTAKRRNFEEATQYCRENGFTSLASIRDPAEEALFGDMVRTLGHGSSQNIYWSDVTLRRASQEKDFYCGTNDQEFIENHPGIQDCRGHAFWGNKTEVRKNSLKSA